MNGENVQSTTQQEKEAIRQFLDFLAGEKPDAAQAYANMLRQMDGMEKQLDAALRELSTIRKQLAKMQESPEKGILSRAIEAVGGRIRDIKESLAEMKKNIAAGAKETVAEIKRFGIKALDRAVSGIGLKRGLEAVMAGISDAIYDVQKSMERVEAVGAELRSTGGHLKNAGRAAMGKGQMAVEKGQAGRFQKAILAPLRMEKEILKKANGLAMAALESAERLEVAGKKARSESIREERGENIRPRETDVHETVRMGKENKTEKKPSVLNDLQERKRQTTALIAPAAERRPKVQEAAL